MAGRNEKEWPLDVYRRTTRGWEKQVPANLLDGEHSLQPNATGVPKVGCIVIKRFRLKIVLASRSSHDSGSSDSEKNNVNKDGLMEVVRRHNCLLLSSPKKRLRTILLKFPSIKDCIEFSDELMLLNRDLYESANAASRPINGHDEEGKLQEESPTGDESEGVVHQNEVFSHIVRLLHDESFLSLTDQVEKLINSNPDGVLILEALGLRENGGEKSPGTAKEG